MLTPEVYGDAPTKILVKRTNVWQLFLGMGSTSDTGLHNLLIQVFYASGIQPGVREDILGGT
jgi:hypothetical protein